MSDQARSIYGPGCSYLLSRSADVLRLALAPPSQVPITHSNGRTEWESSQEDRDPGKPSLSARRAAADHATRAAQPHWQSSLALSHDTRCVAARHGCVLLPRACLIKPVHECHCKTQVKWCAGLPRRHGPCLQRFGLRAHRDPSGERPCERRSAQTLA